MVGSIPIANDADAYGNTVEADKLRGAAVDPRAGLLTDREHYWCVQVPHP